MPFLLLVLAQISEAVQHRPLVAVPLLFGAGLLTSLNPCIYPMIPITAGTLAGVNVAGRTRRHTVGLTLTYVSGLALFYALLGMIAGLSGSLFGTIGASFWARLAIGNLLLVFALAMLEVIPVRLPPRLAAWAGGLGGGSYPAVFLLGATSGLVAAPCGAPAFAAVLTWVATTRSGLLGFIYLFVFSLGMTALLVVVGLFSGTLSTLPRAGAWMSWIKKAAGVVLLLMAEYYFVKAGQVW
ncbi:MAG TPA: cytochrome c biogenesis protein CcdA [Gemmatimonadales bacterium]|nr:cytochrome c biogenesis protein CcdA [Gemmatimonadales bacterium]